MNYLAHMYLSCTDENLIIGNMLVDMLPIKRLRELPDLYQEGFRLHRLIDSYTDTHPVVKLATAKLRQNHRKYAPVVIDIFYDYVLSLEWSRYSGEPLQEFCNHIYVILEKHYHHLPSDIVSRLQKMIKGNYLMTCSSPAAIRSVFNIVSGRSRFANSFGIATDDLLENYDYFKDNFNSFFPDMIAQVDKFCDC